MKFKYKLSEETQQEKHNIENLLKDAKIPDKEQRQIISLFCSTFGKPIRTTDYSATCLSA